MKKLLSVLLSVVMVCMISVPVFAYDPTDLPEDVPVTASYIEAPDADIVYSVDITWGDMAFTYDEGYPGDWNPSTHVYDNVILPEWKVDDLDNGGNLITATNRSNVAVTVGLGVAITEPTNGISGYFDTASHDLPSADTFATYAEVPTVDSSLTLSGTPTDPTALDGSAIGSVTITIADTVVTP